jgi:hypothetical protein
MMARQVPMHPTRRARCAEIEVLDPEADYAEVFRRTSMVELSWEMRLGWNLAFYSTFGVPRMAALLASTGRIEHDSIRRGHDTGLMVYELIHHGLDHPRARAVLRRLNGLHRGWGIEQEDYLFVLASLAVVPGRVVREWGWRAMSAGEQAAAARWYADLGRRMAIRQTPDSYEGFIAYFDDYEARAVTYSPDGARLTDATLRFLATRLPGPLAGRAGEVAGSFLSPRMRVALGLPPTRRSTRLALSTALTARAATERRRPAAEGTWFSPGMAGSAHPNGYEVADLGRSPLRG